MLRTSVAAAATSAAALSRLSTRTPTLAHPRSLLCKPCSTHTASQTSCSSATSAPRTFTSSALVSRAKSGSVYRPRSERGEPTRGFAARWGMSAEHGAKPKDDRRGRFFKPMSQHSKPASVKKADFSAPEAPTAQSVGRKLVEKLSTMVEDPELPSQLVAYGIRGTSARFLIGYYNGASRGRRDSNVSREADSDAAIELFRTWAEQAKASIPHLALLHDQNKPAQADLFAYLSDAVSSFSSEGEECLARLCISAFLDWVDRGLEALSSCSSEHTHVETAELARTRSQLSLLRSCMDLRFPVYQHSRARSLTRNIHLHVGPTNSGKTHGALVALSKARTGVFAGPLRLLAHEVWDRFNNGTVSPGIPPRACNLVTGEEQRKVDPMAGLVSCTVEMVSLTHAVDVGVIDEIQMIGDAHRGSAWTNAVIGLPAKEVHLCGEASVIPLIQNLAKACGDHLTVHHYQRLTPLTVAHESLNDDLSAIQKGDCIVAFSRTAIFTLKREIESKTGLRCAVAYGALPPETKSEQAKLFNQGKLDVMVASDAIGMGLNLRIKRVIFDTLTKWNGKDEVTLSASQIKQIAGRAGRYGTQNKDTKKADVGGVVTTRHQHELELLREALASPLVPITRGAMQPSSETLSQLSATLPAKSGERSGLRTLSQILADVSLLSRIDAKNFFLSDFSQQLAISPLVETASNGMLTVQERETFSNAPANMRDERVVAFVCKAVRQFSRGGLVKFDMAAKDLSMLEVEDEVVTLMRSAMDARERYAGKAHAEELPLVAYLSMTDAKFESGLTEGSAAHPLINITTLLILESLHRCFTLYLWLSFRFPLAFCYRSEVDKRKKQAEDAIDFVLHGIRFGRAKRLQALGRAPPPSKPRR